MFGGLSGDLRVALRRLRSAPQFTAAVAVTLALGIGANVAIFSVVDAVLFQESPFEAPDRLVMVWETDRASETSHEPASWPDILDLREGSETLSGIASMKAAPATLTGTGEPERVAALAVTPDLPDLLGVRPLVGRSFEPGAGAPGSPRLALLGEELWRRRFGADPAMVGSTLTLDGLPTRVVGVLPADADLGIRQVHAKADYSAPLAGPEVEIWLAEVPSPETSPRQTHPYLTLGRLAPGASIEAAQAELDAIMAELERRYPENADRGVNLEAYETVTFGPVRPALLVLFGAVILVLFVACANVANLMLARATVRFPDLAVRRALGAGTGRLARQFLVESSLLAALGAASGVALAFGGLRILVALAPPDVPRLASAGVDGRVLAFAAVVGGVVAVAFGLVPLVRLRRPDLRTMLETQGGARATSTREGRRLRSVLVVSEVALAVMLVIGSGLLLRSFRNLAGVDPGFRTAGVLKAEYRLPDTRYPMDFSRWPELPAINGFHAELLRRVRGLPGVEAASIAGRHPLDPGFTNSFVIEGREAEADGWPEIRCRFVTPGYLETMEVPLLAGRAFRNGDGAGSAPVGVINRAAAERYFRDSDPLGHKLRFWGVSWRIVGVVGDERFHGLAEEPEPAVYAPILQAPQQSGVLLARAAGDPASLAAPIRRIVHELDPQLALHGVEPLERTVAASIAQQRFQAVLLALFGGLAILLALVGIHGVLGYTVAQRRAEMAVRMALGARRRDVLGLVVRQGAGLAVLGTGLGLIGALAGSRVLSNLTFGVSPHEPGIYLAVAAGVVATAGLASWLPARRAARAEGITALLTE